MSGKPPKTAAPAPHDVPSFDIAWEVRLLQDIVDEALAQGMWIVCAVWLGQTPSAAAIIKAAVVKVLMNPK
ncbi:hypothetical protein EDB83DRAFT_2526814 [Lactarius deliciosus]|nr:hypothetical protein EDB83DRAFT_2526814 [Lactarius deliciosus]